MTTCPNDQYCNQFNINNNNKTCYTIQNPEVTRNFNCYKVSTNDGSQPISNDGVISPTATVSHDDNNNCQSGGPYYTFAGAKDPDKSSVLCKTQQSWNELNAKIDVGSCTKDMKKCAGPMYFISTNDWTGAEGKPIPQPNLENWEDIPCGLVNDQNAQHQSAANSLCGRVGNAQNNWRGTQNNYCSIDPELANLDENAIPIGTCHGTAKQGSKCCKPVEGYEYEGYSHPSYMAGI